MKNRIPGIILLSLCISPGGEALARESYRAELALDFDQYSDDGDYDYESIDAAARIYFSPVNVDDHPLAEASFLERAGNVVFGAGRAESESSSTSGDSPYYFAGMTFAKKESPFVAQVQYQATDWDWDFDTFDATLESEQYLLGAGWFVAPTGLVSFSWIHRDSEFKADGVPNRTYDDDYYIIGAKYVGKLADGAAYNVESALSLSEHASDSVNDKNKSFAISGDYYLSRLLSFGGGLSLNRGDDQSDEGNSYMARAKWFVTPRFSAELELSEFVASHSGQDDTTSTEFTLAVRF